MKKRQGKTTIAALTKEVNKHQAMKYGTVQLILNMVYERKNAAFPTHCQRLFCFLSLITFFQLTRPNSELIAADLLSSSLRCLRI